MGKMNFKQLIFDCFRSTIKPDHGVLIVNANVWRFVPCTIWSDQLKVKVNGLETDITFDGLNRDNIYIYGENGVYAHVAIPTDKDCTITVSHPSYEEILTYQISKPEQKISAMGMAIATIVHNQETFLPEWLAFYRRRGVNRFYLYDNHTADRKALEAITEGSDVTVVDYSLNKYLYPPNLLRARKEGAYKFHEYVPQSEFLIDVLHRHGGHHEYLLIIDVDEFVFTPKYPTFDKYLNAISPSVSAIIIESFSFGCKTKPSSNSLIQAHQYRKAQSEGPDNRTKYILRPSQVTYLHVHSPKMYTGSIYRPGVEEIRINHYMHRNKEIPIYRGVKSCNHGDIDGTEDSTLAVIESRTK